MAQSHMTSLNNAFEQDLPVVKEQSHADLRAGMVAVEGTLQEEDSVSIITPG